MSALGLPLGAGRLEETPDNVRFRFAQADLHGWFTPLSVLPSLPDHVVGTPDEVISELNGWPTLPLSTLRRLLADSRCMTRGGHNGAASPFM